MTVVENFPAIRDLMDETERNIKLVELESCEFLTPVLNEWRYASRHVVNLLGLPEDGEELAKAIRHLRRARYDSYDVLITVQFMRMREMEEDIGYYADCVAKFVPDYAEWQVKLEEIKARRKDALKSDNRETFYAFMKDANEQIGVYLSKLRATRPLWMADIRKTERKNKLAAIGVYAAVFAAVLQGLQIVVSFFS